MKELKTILIADDNPKDVELTLEAISANNFANRVSVVYDGVEAIEFLRCEGRYRKRKKENPALILLDLKMPRMDGIEVLQAIRTDPSLKMLPVVMLTSSKEKPDLVRCYELGANAYVVKPVDFHEFLETIRHIGIFWTTINVIPQFEDCNARTA